MHWNTSASELVTSATNVPLCVFSLAAVGCLWQRRGAHPLRAAVWLGMFGGLAIATALGILAHGLALTPAALEAIWQPINAALGVTVACFAGGAVLDRWGARPAARAWPALLLLSAGFFGFATFWSKSFLPFIVYEGVAMLFCLGAYLSLAVQRRLPGAPWMVAGVAITILAALLQATRAVSFTPAVPLDHNGVFHLVQLPGLFCLLAGLKPGLGPPQRKDINNQGTIPERSRSHEQAIAIP